MLIGVADESSSATLTASHNRKTHTLNITDSLNGMMTSWNGNIFRVTGHLCGEFTGPRWIPRTKASDVELLSFLWSASEQTVD